MRPMFERLPLSPLRPHASRTSGTSTITSPTGSNHGAGVVAGEAGAAAGSAAATMSTALRCPSTTTPTGTRRLSSRNEKGLIKGDGDGRPPAGIVVPGDHDVPDGAISRAKISSAFFIGWSTTMRTIASRDAPVRACAP